MAIKRLVITSGEPAGIGPDLCLLWALYTSVQTYPIVVVSSIDLLAKRSSVLGVDINIIPVNPKQLPILPAPSKSLYVWDRPLNASATTISIPKKSTARYVLDLLDIAIKGCLRGDFSGMVTGPIHKGIINAAGINFSGHTEYIADVTSSKKAVMMLASKEMRVALMTTHLPLSRVTESITSHALTETLNIINHDLYRYFRIINPRITVCGLNPHAGEGGYLGYEEIEIINPVLVSLRKKGMNLSGPLPADTVFTPKCLSSSDIILAMYHDQGLPVLKSRAFGSSVNITLGLPIIRTSVDHGTALNLAGTGKISVVSLDIAVQTAFEMAEKNA